MNKDPRCVLAGCCSHVFAQFRIYSAMDIVQVILESVLLRREKTTRDKDGNFIVHLPPKTVTIQYLDLSAEESKIYGILYKNIKADYDSLNNRGLVVKNVTSILAQIMTCVVSTLMRISQSDVPLLIDSVEQPAIPVSLNDILKVQRNVFPRPRLRESRSSLPCTLNQY